MINVREHRHIGLVVTDRRRSLLLSETIYQAAKLLF